MTGFLWMKILLVQYVGCAAVFLFQGDYPRGLYWIGAAIITSAVLWIK